MLIYFVYKIVHSYLINKKVPGNNWKFESLHVDIHPNCVYVLLNISIATYQNSRCFKMVDVYQEFMYELKQQHFPLTSAASNHMLRNHIVRWESESDI